MSANTKNQLTLWSFQTPTETVNQFLGIAETKGQDKNGQEVVKGISVKLIKTKTLAQLLGLTGRHNRASLAKRELELNDALKEQFGKEVVGIVASPKFTAGGMRVTNSGISFRFKRVDRAEPVISPDDAIKALMAKGFTDDQILEMVMKAKAAKEAPIEVSSTQEIVDKVTESVS